MNPIKTIAVFEDVSGVGRCALSVAIPVISAIGCQCCPVPTALLSAHTGFGKVLPLDCTDFVKRAVDEWNEMGRFFNCALSGYMPSAKCVDEVEIFMRRQKANGATVIVDPAMADDGKLYRSLKSDIIPSYRRLCAHADVITPNETEARLLSGASPDACLDEIMRGLLRLGAKTAIVTGWTVRDGLCANAYKKEGGELKLCEYEPLDARFPGTGDVLAACLAGYITKGIDGFEALSRATHFVRSVMKATMDEKIDRKEGIMIEMMLRLL